MRNTFWDLHWLNKKKAPPIEMTKSGKYETGQLLLMVACMPSRHRHWLYQDPNNLCGFRFYMDWTNHIDGSLYPGILLYFFSDQVVRLLVVPFSKVSKVILFYLVIIPCLWIAPVKPD